MPLWGELELEIPSLYRFALRLTVRTDQAEDLTQDTLLRAWQRRGQLRDHGSLRVWLFQILVNLHRDQLRQMKARPRLEPARDSPDDRSPLPEQAVMLREELNIILKAMNSLPPRQREVLHLSAVENFSLAEIAEGLGISVNAAKVNLCEARKKMRQAFPAPSPTTPNTPPR